MSKHRKFAVGEWNHLFGVGRKETRCRIVIDLEQSKLVAAQEWTGLKFVDVLGDRLKDLAESVIEVNQAHAKVEEWAPDPEFADELPEWVSPRNLSNCIEQPAASRDKAVELKNVLGQVTVKPFYIWANESCEHKSDSFKEAKAIRLALFNEGCDSVHIVDADGVEVVDAEIEAHEALVNAGFFAGERKPDVKPEFPGAFMVNDPLDPDGYAIVGDDIAALILEARDHLIESASQPEMPNATEQPPTRLNSAQQSALMDLRSALSKATDCGLFDEFAAHSHPDRINSFCDDLDAFAVAEGVIFHEETSKWAVTKSRFDTEQEANDYKRKHQHINMVAEPIGGGKWGLVFPIESHVTVNDGAPAGMRQHDGKVERAGVFQSSHEQHSARNGQSFVLLGTVDPSTYDADDVGPMYRIKFSDSEVIEAWPDEVQSALPQSKVALSLDDDQDVGPNPHLHAEQWNEVAREERSKKQVGNLQRPSGEFVQVGKLSDSIEQAPATKLVEVRLSALTRVEYMEVVEVPANITQAELDDLVNARYRQVDGGEFTSDPEYWERGTCDAVVTDMPNAVPSMMAFRTAHGLHIERAVAAAQTVESSGPTP